MGRLHVAYRYLKNDRLRHYERILAMAKENAYEVVGMATAHKILQRCHKSRRLLVLRHDVDRVTSGAKAMAKIEKSLGIASTFYFRWKTFDLELVAEIHKLGHECSFHFETVSDYYLEKGLDPQKVPLTRKIIHECLLRLRTEISKFEETCVLHGIPLRLQTIAAHGTRVNRILGFPGNRLLDYDKNGLCDGLMEAYAPDFLTSCDCYISDCTLRNCLGYRYGVSPCDAITQGKRMIIFLSHPSHWYGGFWERVARAGITLLIGVNRKVGVFKYY